ncbi:branched-chain amino acid transaminase [Crenothrix polyspora]|uniref:Branched-chain-amino-acid aminotransferase n=1 Tax=Crenothrix polyspora TaxID=360316 RepID=A0A1R4HA70_9GAMM|nr:branched-chain amino acid transaminase [Crenothrix polyspora]SJM93077.1 Branched-chain-amino-acid aminotransferase [Crenothrix polyspora]
MGMEDRDGFIWLDGKWTAWREAKVHVLTHTLHYGLGVFEGIRAYKTDKGTAVFKLQEHTDRLFRSAHIMNMPMPFSKDEINQAQCEAVSKNGLDSAYIRSMCFYGSEGMGLRADNLKVHVMVAAWAWGAYLGDDSIEKGIRIRTSSYVRNHHNSTMCKAKANGNYINSILALQEARANGYDEALMLDHEGFAAEGSAENLFIVRNGKIYTPETTSALEGITRDTVMTIAREQGYEVIEKRITRDEIYVADEAFFTGSAAEVTPIRELDNRLIGSGSRGPVTEKLQSLYFDYVKDGRPEHKDWLTYV